jgi:hypothetical protein
MGSCSLWMAKDGDQAEGVAPLPVRLEPVPARRSHRWTQFGNMPGDLPRSVALVKEKKPMKGM